MQDFVIYSRSNGISSIEMERERERARRRAFFHKADGCWHASSVLRCGCSLARSPACSPHISAHVRRHARTHARTRMPDTYGRADGRAHAVRDSINKHMFAVLSNLRALPVYEQRAISATRNHCEMHIQIIAAVVFAPKCGEKRAKAKRRSNERVQRIVSHRIASPLQFHTAESGSSPRTSLPGRGR